MLKNILLVHIELSFRTIARAEILILNIVAIYTYYSEGINLKNRIHKKISN